MTTIRALTGLAVLLLAAKPVLSQSIDAGISAATSTDKSIALAEAEGDQRYLMTRLDYRFSLIDWTGTVRTRAQFLSNLPTVTPADQADGLETRFYSDLAVVTGNHYMRSLNVNTRFMHVFVNRAGTWKAFAFVETAIQTASVNPSAATGAGPVPIPPGASAHSCENPCVNIPFSPRNTAERDVLDAYKQVEIESVTGDVDAFAAHLADELLIVVPNYKGKPVTKSDAVASHQHMKDQNIYYPPVPITQADVAVFGDAALITSRHAAPSDPAKSSILVQLWVRRDSRWQLALSQQIRS